HYCERTGGHQHRAGFDIDWERQEIPEERLDYAQIDVHAVLSTLAEIPDQQLIIGGYLQSRVAQRRVDQAVEEHRVLRRQQIEWRGTLRGDPRLAAIQTQLGEDVEKAADPETARRRPDSRAAQRRERRTLPDHHAR